LASSILSTPNVPVFDLEFLGEELKPGSLEQACICTHHPLDVRMQEGYDHSYYFIATFIDDHLRHHARALGLLG
jgi:S-formylglutathione hydrolase